jgi:MoaA/NifB/PqqE/SkfB family radical SAM enzyme
VPHVINNLQELGVSIDGASEHTYERLRLGGKWAKINEALECMAEQKQKHGFRFILHFVVQKDNYHEMEKIIDLGERYEADRVWLNKIQDWGTMDDFESNNIWHTPEFKEQLDKVVSRIHRRDNDRFIECPTLVTEEVRRKNKN